MKKIKYTIFRTLKPKYHLERNDNDNFIVSLKFKKKNRFNRRLRNVLLNYT